MQLTSIDEMIEMCGLSRLHAGVHFKASIAAGSKLGKPIGQKCFERYREIAGVGSKGNEQGNASPGVIG
jgi:hypothetical protein